ncbi:MAG: glycosyltransferase family 2 protein [Terracidiphilus sp.]
MPNEPPLLTIAIPTYNRQRMLEQLLADLIDQIGPDTRVELLVSDNASPDGTPGVVRHLLDQGVAIRSIRNETNLGPDRNILQCFLEATGNYVWVFSDDDLLQPGTVQRILAVIAKREYDLICIRLFGFNGEYQGPKPFKPRRDLEFVSPASLARRVHVNFTFISGVIVNRARIVSLPHRPFESLVGTNLVQLGPCYSALNHHRRSLLIRDPLVAARGNRNVGYALYRVFGTNFAGITRDWLEIKSTQRAILNGALRVFFPYWLLLSRVSAASRVQEDPQAVLRKAFRSNPLYWIFDYPICTLPLPLAKAWSLAVRAFNKAVKLLLDLS